MKRAPRTETGRSSPAHRAQSHRPVSLALLLLAARALLLLRLHPSSLLAIGEHRATHRKGSDRRSIGRAPDRRCRPQGTSHPIMAEPETSKAKPRPIVRLGTLLISHSVFVRYRHQRSILIICSSLFARFCSGDSSTSASSCASTSWISQCRLLRFWRFGSALAADSRQEHLHFRKCPHARSILDLSP